MNNLDLAVFKNFSLVGRTKLQFRLESFNVLNHTQFSSVDTEPHVVDVRRGQWRSSRSHQPAGAEGHLLSRRAMMARVAGAMLLSVRRWAVGSIIALMSAAPAAPAAARQAPAETGDALRAGRTGARRRALRRGAAVV